MTTQREKNSESANILTLEYCQSPRTARAHITAVEAHSCDESSMSIDVNRLINIIEHHTNLIKPYY